MIHTNILYLYNNETIKQFISNNDFKQIIRFQEIRNFYTVYNIQFIS